MNEKKVTVIIPAYNAELFITESIESILSQSYNDFEILLIDDYSTDNTKEIIKSYLDNPKVRAVFNNKNCGIAQTRNIGLDNSNGKYIAWLDSDDISKSNRLSEQVKILDKQKDVGICGTWTKTFGIRKKLFRYPIDSDFIRGRLLFDSPLATSSVMMRQTEERFDVNNSPAEDYDMWERLSHKCKIVNIPKTLTYYRLHDKQSSTVNKIIQKKVIDNILSRQLNVLGFLYSNEEFIVHKHLHSWSFGESKEFLSSAYDWILKLHEANNISNIYPEPAFTKVLAERWFFVCRRWINEEDTWNLFIHSRLSSNIEMYKKIYLLALKYRSVVKL